MLLTNEEFFKKLPDLFTGTQTKGAVTMSMKRYDYQPSKSELNKMVTKLSLGEREYATLIRAQTEHQKISTLVQPQDLDVFLAQYHGLLVMNLDSIKKNERLRVKNKKKKSNK